VIGKIAGYSHVTVDKVVVASAIAASASSSKDNHVLLSDLSNLSVKGQIYFSS
jgi:hypothetical protein